MRWSSSSDTGVLNRVCEWPDLGVSVILTSYVLLDCAKCGSVGVGEPLVSAHRVRELNLTVWLGVGIRPTLSRVL